MITSPAGTKIYSTQADLSAFHQRTFGRPAPANSFPPSSEAITNADSKKDASDGHDQLPYANADSQDWQDQNLNDNENDDLGHYPDGVKRTLTDEQIAMFRHSEIYALLRIKQKERELDAANTSSDDLEPGHDTVDDIQSTEKSERVAHSQAEQSPSTKHDAGLEKAGMDHFMANKTTQDPRNRGHDPGLLEQEQNQPQSEANGSTTSKRKRSDADIERPPQPDRLTRARVRDLDTFTTTDEVLDYGDNDISDSKAADDAMEDSNTAAPSQNPPKGEGRKIWWPVLNA